MRRRIGADPGPIAGVDIQGGGGRRRAWRMTPSGMATVPAEGNVLGGGAGGGRGETAPVDGHLRGGGLDEREGRCGAGGGWRRALVERAGKGMNIKIVKNEFLEMIILNNKFFIKHSI